MDGVRKKMYRIQQLTAQTVGRAGKTDILSELQPLESKVEKLAKALQEAKTQLETCIRTRSKEVDNPEKRKRKLEEHALAASLLHHSKELESLNGGADLLARVMCLYGESLEEICGEQVRAEQELEKKVFERFSKYLEDEKHITHQREKLKKAVLDMDSAKRRMSQHQSQGGSAEKMELIQDELDAAWGKVEHCKDNLVADMHVLNGKEIDMASIFTLIVEIQHMYYRTCAENLEGLLPKIQQKIATYPRRPVFGCHLEDHLRYTGRNIATVIEVCCAALNEIGLSDEGLFRISGNATKVRKLKTALDAGEVELSDYDRDPHSIAGALKSYLRELPDPLMSHNLFTQWLSAARLEGEQRLDAIKECLSMLPKSNYDNLRYLIKFLVKVTKNKDVNKMSPSNLAIVMGPNLIWMDSEGDNFLGSKIVESLITNAEFFFPGEIQFTSNLIHSLHEKSGGFVAPAPLPVAAIGKNSDIRGNHSDNGSLHSTDSGSSLAKKGSPAPANVPNHRRPKAPAPPPPPSGHRLRETITENYEAEGGYTEIPNLTTGGGGLSHSSSANDSLNEYGSDPDQDYVAVPEEDSRRDPNALYTPIRKSPPAEIRHSSSDSQPSQSKTDPAVPTFRGHRKTNSLDRPQERPPKVPPPSYAVGSLERKPKVPTIALETEGTGKNSIKEEPDESEAGQPLRPPLPSKENLERRSVLVRSESQAKKEKSPPGGKVSVNLYPNLSQSVTQITLSSTSDDSTSTRSESGPKKGFPPSQSTTGESNPPSSRPKRPPQLPLAQPKDSITVPEASKRLSLNITVNGGGVSPDSPHKPKPPVPVKPKLDPEMTHL